MFEDKEQEKMDFIAQGVRICSKLALIMPEYIKSCWHGLEPKERAALLDRLERDAEVQKKVMEILGEYRGFFARSYDLLFDRTDDFEKGRFIEDLEKSLAILCDKDAFHATLSSNLEGFDRLIERLSEQVQAFATLSAPILGRDPFMARTMEWLESLRR